MPPQKTNPNKRDIIPRPNPITRHQSCFYFQGDLHGKDPEMVLDANTARG